MELAVSDTHIALTIWQKLQNDSGIVETEDLDFYFETVGGWVEELIRHGRFSGISLEETYLRLSHLLEVDLYAFMTKEEEIKTKKQWVKGHWIEDLTTLDAPALRAYASFVEVAARLFMTRRESALFHRLLDSTLSIASA